MRYLILAFLAFMMHGNAIAQWAVCDTMGLSYIAAGVKFEDALLGSYDSDIVVPIVNNTGTHFAYPQAKLINTTPLPPGMSLYSTGWNVFASAWNDGDTASANIGYYVTTPVPPNFTVKFNLYVTNFAPLAVDSCVFTDTLTLNLNPVPTGIGVAGESGGKLLFYPNPADDVMTVYGLKANDIVDVLTADGRLVRTVEVTAAPGQINVSCLPAGLYIIKERSRGLAGKMIKNK